MAIDEEAQRHWLLINLKNPASSLNLTQIFGLDFDQVTFVGGSANQLFVLSDHQLRRIDVSSRQISSVLLNQVDAFSSQGSNILYLTLPQTTSDGSLRTLGTYRDGEAGGAAITTLPGDASVLIALSRYYDNDYLAYIVDDRLTVYYGSLPSYSEDASVDPFANLSLLIDAQTLTETPTALTVSPAGEYLIAHRDRAFTAIDLDMGELSAYDAPEAALNWLDQSMLYSVSSDRLVVWDFDGSNTRTLVAADAALDTPASAETANHSTLAPVTTRSASPLADYPVAITSNNKWLYYLTGTDSGYTLVREQIWN